MDKDRAAMPPTYSLVVPIFNEEAVIPILLRRLDALLAALDAEGEVIVVDDGSDDTSAIVIEAKARADKRYRLIKLSRNFGHQIAITVGLDHAAGHAVIVMDADLQDPPEVVLAMIAKWKEGYDVVSAERVSREGESRFKRATADLFYRLMARLGDVPPPRNAGDFRLVDRQALDCFLAMPERDRFVRGMFAWIGFRQGTVAFDRPARAAGRSKYSLRKMICAGGERAPVVLRRAASPGALDWRRSVRAGIHLWIERDRAVGVRRSEPRERLELDDRGHRRARRRQHADDRRRSGSMSGAFTPRRRAGRSISSSAPSASRTRPRACGGRRGAGAAKTRKPVFREEARGGRGHQRIMTQVDPKR